MIKTKMLKLMNLILTIQMLQTMMNKQMMEKMIPLMLIMEMMTPKKMAMMLLLKKELMITLMIKRPKMMLKIKMSPKMPKMIILLQKVKKILKTNLPSNIFITSQLLIKTLKMGLVSSQKLKSLKKSIAMALFMELYSVSLVP
jgi:hypothetical protein